MSTLKKRNRANAKEVAVGVSAALKRLGVSPRRSNGCQDPDGLRLKALFDKLPFLEEKEFSKTRKAGEALVGWLQQHGQIYLDQDNPEADGIYWLDKRNDGSRLRALSGSDCAALLASKCGRRMDDKFFVAAKDHLITRVLDPDSNTAARANIVYSWTTQGFGNAAKCYISNGSLLVRCSSAGVDLVPMGTDGVLIPEKYALPKWDLCDDKDAGKSPDELPFIAGSGLDRNGCVVLGLYLTLLPLSRPGEVPPLALEGAPQSGKTTALVEAGRLFFGDTFRATDPVGQDAERAIPRLLNISRLLVWDNLDNLHSLRGFADRLAASTTGAASAEKTHYKNRDVTHLPVNAVQMLSAVSTEFLIRHPTLASRLINLSWEEIRADFDMQSVREATRSKRSSVLSHIAHTISKTIAAFDSTEKVRFRFDYWARLYTACARVMDCESSATEALSSALKRSQERGVAADKYGAMFLDALQPGDTISGDAGEILDAIKSHAFAEDRISPASLGRWLRTVQPVSRVLSVVCRYDTHKKQHHYRVTRTPDID